MIETRRDRVEQRLTHMKSVRQRHEARWKQLRENFLPGRGRFSGEREGQVTEVVLINDEPVIAAETLGSGLHAGLTSPARPWLKSNIDDASLKEWGDVQDWLAEVDKQLLRYFAKSNLYTALPSMYEEYGTFGVMCALAFEDDEALFRFEPYTIGTYWLARNAKGVFDTLYREFPMTVRQMVEQFGERAVSADVLRMWRDSSQRETEQMVLHTVEPNGLGQWVCCYWEVACKSGPRQGLLKEARQRKNPILAATWKHVTGETYASSWPGKVALGDAKALQVDERDLARAQQRHHNPPMQGPALLNRAGISLAPGAMNWVDATQATGQNGHIRPVHDFRPDLTGLQSGIDRKQRRINRAYFVDLFMMLTLDERAQRATAEEIRAKYDEKVLALGPTLEQSNGMLRVLYDWAFDVLVERSRPIWEGRVDGEPLLPPPPKELENVEINAEFVSALQQAQRAQTLQGLERYLAAVAQVAQLMGEVPDKADLDQWIDEMAAGLGVSPKVLRDDAEVEARRVAKAEQQQTQQMAALAPALKDAATAVGTLAQTQPTEGNILSALGGVL